MTHRGVVLGMCLIASSAGAQPAEDLVETGQELAKRAGGIGCANAGPTFPYRETWELAKP